MLRRIVLLLAPLICDHGAALKELQSLAVTAHSLPPEFAADVLLKLADSPAADSRWKRGLVEDASTLARYAPRSYPQRGDAQAADLLILGVDSLSLQTRAVKAMAPLDRQRALTMFQDIPRLSLPQLSCREALTPDVSGYYHTAALLFQNAFTPEQRRKGDDVQLLRRVVSAIDSPSQVVPALKLLDQLELPAPTRSELAAAFLAAIRSIHGGDREFSVSESLLVSAAVPQMHEPDFLPALRGYIVRQVSGPRCSDQMRGGQLPPSVLGFNKLISQVDRPQVQFRPISAEEAAPLKDDGTYPPPAPASAYARQLTRSMETLGGLASSSEAWRVSAPLVLQSIEDWNPQAETSFDDYFWRRALLYNELAFTAASTPMRLRVLANALHFLEQQYDTRRSDDLWFAVFRRIFTPERLADPVLLDQLAHSRNSVISVYAQLQQLTGDS